jgi:hypothetical protein
MKTPNTLDTYKSGKDAIESIDNLILEISLQCKEAHNALKDDNAQNRNLLIAKRDFTSKQAKKLSEARWLIINTLLGEV